MENENTKIGFFTRVKIAVAKLENYSIFLEEKTSVAVKYFLLMILILAVVMSAVETYTIMKMVNKGYQYVQNEMPDFSYQDGILNFSENINAYDEEFDVYMIADTTEDIAEEKMQEYKDTIKSTGVIFLKDKVIYQVGSNQTQYHYEDIASSYDMHSLDKAGLIEKVNSIGLTTVAGMIFLFLLFGLYIIEMIMIFMDWLIITFFTIIVSRICRIILPFKAAFNISIYALTLSIILTIFYNVAYYLAGFYTDYFRLVYLLISYVYIVAVILMLKSDLLKQQVEIGKIVEVQKQVHEELKKQEEKDEESKKENKKPEENKEDKKDDTEQEKLDGEPDGSEI